jgi:kumamolisin
MLRASGNGTDPVRATASDDLEKGQHMPDLPADYVALEGSRRRPSPGAVVTGPADPGKSFTVSIVLRRRPDGPPVPDFSYYTSTPRAQRRRLSGEDFAARYGAADDDIAKVVAFVTSHGLRVAAIDAAARTVKASGTVAQMSEAFGVTLQTYEHEVTPRAGQEPVRESYRGRDGVISAPRDLAPIIVGVFGLDDRRVTKRNNGDPPHTRPIPVAAIPKLYNFPANSAVGQTIAIFSEGGYAESDISATFGGHPPTVASIAVDASNDGTADFETTFETTQDICIAAIGAPGANVAVYFTAYSQAGWVDLLNRVIHPPAGDPTCQVLSSSFYVTNGDDPPTLASDEVSSSWLTAVNLAFQDAAIQHVTVCIASGDTGAQSTMRDGRAHVQYPASDPWVLSVGGTSIGNVSGASFTEYAWNDDKGASGGGVSYFFARPSYQDAAGVPASVNPDHHVGRGVPDVAANASPHSGYSGIYVKGSPQVGNGTSASSPLWAGLIAVINAALGEPVGFLNPQLYELGSSVCRDIVSPPGPGNNSFAGTTGYPVGTGWDACTGWGSPNGVTLLAALQRLRAIQPELGGGQPAQEGRQPVA